MTILPTIGRFGLAAGVVLCAACGDASSSETTAASASVSPRVLTFTRDVAPIVFEHCVGCHRAGETAPFSLMSYSDVRQHARTIVAATGRRFMPPWLPEAGHGDFAGERRLTPAQIDTLRGWEEQGAPEGSPDDLPPLPQFTEGWRLGEPDILVKLPEIYTLRADGSDVWRNFVVPLPVSQTRYVRTVEIRPGSARFVHHALMGIDATRSSRRRDAKDTEAGFDGMDMGDAQAPDGHLLGWTPGMAPFPGIEGQAWRLDPGTDLVLQLHMIPSGKPESVDPVVGLYFAKTPPAGPPMYLLRLDADQMLDIPPGARDFAVTDSFTLPVDVHVYAAYPHAHFLARTMEAMARLPDGTGQWLIRIAEWDFRWQDVYRYARPVFLPKGSTISMRYTYDNSKDNVRNPNRPPRRVVAGLRSTDEMAHLQLQVLASRAEDALALKGAVYRHAATKTPGDPWVHYEMGNVLRDEGDLAGAVREYRAALALDAGHAAAHNNLGVLLAGTGEWTAAIAHYEQALRVEPDFADALYNLGNALRARGRTADAIGRYRAALRLEPDMAAAHTNLGEALGASGRLEEALVHFRAAALRSPQSAEAHNNLGAALARLGRMDDAIQQFREALAIDPGHVRARENLQLAMERASSSPR